MKFVNWLIINKNGKLRERVKELEECNEKLLKEGVEK